jgi:hypothetical protein
MHLSISNFEDQFVVIDRTPSGEIEFGLTRISLCTCGRRQKTAALGAVFGTLSTTPHPRVWPL